jgi:hypothetical protein
VTRAWGWLATLVAVAGLGTACQERLTAPAECPELCPGGEAEVFDTILTPLAGSDTAYTGFVSRGRAGALLVSNGLPAGEARALYRFAARPDSAEIPANSDSVYAYTVDSVLLSVNLVRRDTLLNGLKLILYRIEPGTADSGVTFPELEAQLVPEAVIDTIAVADTLNAGLVRTVLKGAELAKVAIPPGTGGVLALGVRMTADAPSGVRLGASEAGTGATFVTYATAAIADTGRRRQTYTVPTGFDTYVLQTSQAPDPDLLTVGGEPSSRAILRFDLPQPIEDSATIIRATLELIPVSPMIGLRTDPPLLEAKALLADLGAKSPVTTDSRFIANDTLSVGSADTVRLDVTSIVRLWQSVDERPEAIFLSLLPEAASFTRPVFGSTRSASPGPARLRVTYTKPFPFENP